MAEIKHNTREERARQFAPFDSLSGFFEMIAERERRRDIDTRIRYERDEMDPETDLSFF